MTNLELYGFVLVQGGSELRKVLLRMKCYHAPDRKPAMARSNAHPSAAASIAPLCFVLHGVAYSPLSTTKKVKGATELGPCLLYTSPSPRDRG
eukprot:511196-Amphidinium_carterae.1